MVKHSSQNHLLSRGALDWQADPEDDLGELEVFHHLTQLMTAVTGSNFVAKTPQAVTLLATARVPPDSSGFSWRNLKKKLCNYFWLLLIAFIHLEITNGHCLIC